jgi:hypothetical protein
MPNEPGSFIVFMTAVSSVENNCIAHRLGIPIEFVPISNKKLWITSTVDLVKVCTPSMNVNDEMEVIGIEVTGKLSTNGAVNVKLPETLSIVVYWGVGGGKELLTEVKSFPV